MKISEGIGLGIGVGACALAGYAIYRLFFAGKKSPLDAWTEEQVRRAMSDVEEVLMKINAGQPITETDVEVEEEKYLPSLYALNEQLEMYDKDAVVELPSEYDNLSNAEKALYVKNAVISAGGKLAYFRDRSFWEYIWTTIRTAGIWVMLPLTSYALFRYGQIPELVRKVTPQKPPKGRKIFEVYDQDYNPLDAEILVDGKVYHTTNGTLTLDLFVGQHVVTILANGYKIIRDVIEVVEGSKVNTYQPEPIVNPVTDDPLPVEDPQDTVDTLPLDILSLLAEWTGTTVEWLRQNAYCAAMVALAAAVVVGTALFSRNPMATEAASACVLPYLAPCGIYKTEDEVIKDASPELFQRLKEEGWIVV